MKQQEEEEEEQQGGNTNLNTQAKSAYPFRDHLALKVVILCGYSDAEGLNNWTEATCLMYSKIFDEIQRGKNDSKEGPSQRERESIEREREKGERRREKEMMVSYV